MPSGENEPSAASGSGSHRRNAAGARNFIELRRVVGAVASRSKENLAAVTRPADHHVGAGMVRQPLRLAAACRDGVHVGAAVVVRAECDRRSVRRKIRRTGNAESGNDALRRPARTRHRPNIAAVHERDLRSAHRRTLQQQRLRRHRRTHTKRRRKRSDTKRTQNRHTSPISVSPPAPFMPNSGHPSTSSG